MFVCTIDYFSWLGVSANASCRIENYTDDGPGVGLYIPVGCG